MNTFIRRFVIVVVCVASMCFSFLATRRPWIEPVPPHVRLTPLLPDLKREDVDTNGAFGLLLQGLDLLAAEHVKAGCAWPKELGMGDRAPLDPEMASALEQYEPALALIRQAASTKEGRQVANGTSLDWRNTVINMRAVIQLMVASSFRKSALGDTEGAIRELVTLVELGDMLGTGANLFYSMFAVSVQDEACKAMCKLSLRNGLSRPAILETTNALGRAESNIVSYAEKWRYLYPVASTSGWESAGFDSLAVAQFAGVDERGYVAKLLTAWAVLASDHAETERDLKNLFVHMIAHYDQYPLAGAPMAGVRVGSTNVAPWQQIMQYRDPAGLVSAHASLRSAEMSYAQSLAQYFYLRATTLALAISEYKQQHGAPPEKLEDLIPDFIGKIPEDPFRPGHALVYRRDADNNWLLYSVWIDGKDDGGTGSWQCIFESSPSGFIDLVLSTRELAPPTTNSVPAAIP